MAYLENDSQLDHLHLRIKWAFLREQPADWTMDWWVPYTVFWLVTTGDREIVIDEVPVSLAPGVLITFRQGQTVKVLPGDTPMSYYAMACDCKVGHLHFVDMYRVPTRLRPDQNEALGRLAPIWDLLIRRTEQVAGHFNREQQTISQRHLRAAYQPTLMLDSPETGQYLGLQSLLYQLVDAWFELILPWLPGKPTYFDSRIQEICSYISGHLEQKLTLKELAGQFYMSAGHLTHLFRQSLSISPMEFIRMERMNLARELLLTTLLPVQEISEKIGMPVQSEFSRLFRSREGMSPTQFRKKFRIGSLPSGPA